MVQCDAVVTARETWLRCVNVCVCEENAVGWLSGRCTGDRETAPANEKKRQELGLENDNRQS